VVVAILRLEIIKTICVSPSLRFYFFSELQATTLTLLSHYSASFSLYILLIPATDFFVNCCRNLRVYVPRGHTVRHLIYAPLLHLSLSLLPARALFLSSACLAVCNSIHTHTHTHTHTQRQKTKLVKSVPSGVPLRGDPGGRSLLAQPPVSDGSDVVTRIKR